jgi:hypothetical protein
MGAIEHLKTVCCLGLQPESAMIAVTPLLQEIIPHGQTRIALLEPNAAWGSIYCEHPGTVALFRGRLWKFSRWPLYMPLFRAIGMGWTLQIPGQNWFDSEWYREIEGPLDSCWILDAMIGDGGRSIAFLGLTRPRSAKPFAVDDVQRLDGLRPWLAHAFRRHQTSGMRLEFCEPMDTAGAPVLSGQIIVTADAKIVFQTPSVEALLRIVEGWSIDLIRRVPVRDKLPAPVLKLLKRLNGAVNGDCCTPPRIQISTAYGILTLEAKWLVPAGARPDDIAKDPKGCFIAVTIELREHALAHAARILRESGATPAQVKVGTALAMGKAKPVIANELGIKPSSVADQTKRLYQTLDVHNSTELATRIWLGARPAGTRQPHAPSLDYRGQRGFAS